MGGTSTEKIGLRRGREALEAAPNELAPGACWDRSPEAQVCMPGKTALRLRFTVIGMTGTMELGI